MGPQETELDENKMLFNSGDFEVTMDMGKLIDDDKDGVQFREMVSLNDLYSNFSITQSVFEPYMTLTVHITESKLILERFGTKGLQGEEFIKIKFNTPTKHIIEDIFYVTGYSPIKKDSHELSTGLALKCVSKEKLINDQMTVNQSFEGTTSDIAKNIFNNFIIGSEKFKQMKAAEGWKEKPIVVDESIGTQKFTIPGLTPFAALHFLAIRSFGGSQYPSSFFTFYEAEDAFYFKNIENWNSGIRKESYTHNSELGSLPSHHKDFYKNIRFVSPLAIRNTMDGIHNGEFASKVTSIDFNKKSFQVNEFNLIKERESFNILGSKFSMSSAFFDMFGSDTVESTIVVDSTKGTFNENMPSVLGRRKAYKQMLGHYTLGIVIHGDTSIVAGAVITIELKEAGAPEKKQRGSMYSGNWYVTKVEHIADNNVHNTRLTIVKDGLDFTHSEVG